MKSLKRILAVVLCIALMAPTMVFAADDVKVSPGKVDISSAAASSLTYSGTSQTTTITLDGKTLVLGEDFTITSGYRSHTAAGTYTVTIQGTGNYSGSATLTYKINPKKVSTTVSASNVIYNGKAQTVKPVVKTADGVTLVYGKDYTVSGATHTAAGLYKMTVKGKGNYTFTSTANYRVQYDMSVMSASATKMTYNGKALTTVVTVKNGSTELTRGTDYKLSGTVKATDAGTYKIRVTGIGNYSGSQVIKYTINKASQTGVKVAVSTARKRVGVTGVKDGAKVTYTTSNKNVTVKNGKVSIGKNVKKGTKVVIAVRVAATKNYASYVKRVSYVVK